MKEKLIEENRDNQSKKQEEQSSIPLCGFCTFDYYKQYFQVTTYEVAVKLVCAITIVFYKKFREVSLNKTDLYGPFWIYATIVFSLALSQNFYSFLIRPEHTAFKYTIEYVPKAFMVVYIFGLGIPIFFNLIIRAFGGVISYTKIITIYGYSQVINIIMMLLCVYPDSTAQNFFITWGAVHSSIFIFLTLKEELRSDQSNIKYISVGTLSVCQLILVIIYKKYFFGDIYRTDTTYYQV